MTAQYLSIKLYEVPPKFIGQRIEVRYDETGVYIYEDGILWKKLFLLIFQIMPM